jgi:CRISPR-associated protein Cas1
MSKKTGIKNPELQTLPQIKTRISFLYLERCTINRQDGAITVTDFRGTVHVPAASLSVMLLGPGTKITHRAVELVSITGISLVWVGEQGVRFYAYGNPLTHAARLLIKQAELVSNVRKRIAVAREMYQMRFPDEDVSSLTMQQLRGREGARVRAIYRRESRSTGVQWNGRTYNPDDFESSDEVNQALSSAHTCLYGLTHSVITALGCSPGLGFVHTGHDKSFVYDIADLYKGSITIPVAFEVAAEKVGDIGAETRRRVRDVFSNTKIVKQIVEDIYKLLLYDEEDKIIPEVNIIHLWDDKIGHVKNGISYGHEEELEMDDEIGYGVIVENKS